MTERKDHRTAAAVSVGIALMRLDRARGLVYMASAGVPLEVAYRVALSPGQVRWQTTTFAWSSAKATVLSLEF